MQLNASNYCIVSRRILLLRVRSPSLSLALSLSSCYSDLSNREYRLFISLILLNNFLHLTKKRINYPPILLDPKHPYFLF